MEIDSTSLPPNRSARPLTKKPSTCEEEETFVESSPSIEDTIHIRKLPGVPPTGNSEEEAKVEVRQLFPMSSS